MTEENHVEEVITFDDFLKVDIRAGRVTEAEHVPKSDKLLKLQVDFGNIGSRQILAGIGKFYDPHALVGHTFLFVVNLASRKMMGLDSHGMILAGDNCEGLPAVAICDEAVPGSRAV